MPPGLFASAIAVLALQDSAVKMGEEIGEALGDADGERLGAVEAAALATTDGWASGLAAEGSVLETDELPHPMSITNAAIAIALMCS